MILSLIVAASENNVIGKNGTLPWHLPDDLRHFRSITKGHPVIMGRKTYESIGHALPERTNVVVSRTLQSAPEHCLLARSLEESLQVLHPAVDEEVFVMGGSALFALSLAMADLLYLTRVHAQIDGDAFFPEVDFSVWKEVSSEVHPMDDAHQYPFTFFLYERIRPSQ